MNGVTELKLAQEISDKIGEFIKWKVGELKRVEWENKMIGFDPDEERRNALKLEIKAFTYAEMIAESVIKKYKKEIAND